MSENLFYKLSLVCSSYPPHLNAVREVELRFHSLDGANLLRGYRATPRWVVLVAGRTWEEVPLGGQATNATLPTH